MLTPDYLVGRRFTFLTGKNVPDFTCTGFNPSKGIRVHALDGGKWWVKVGYLRTALKAGVIEESSGAPFVLDQGQYPTPQQQRLAMPQHLAHNNHDVRAIVRRLRTSLRASV